MSDLGTLLITGAGGTVGTRLIDRLVDVWAGEILSVGRTRPSRLRPKDRFEPLDLADIVAAQALSTRIATGPRIDALVCVAGMDSRAGLHDFDPVAFTEVMQVNCLTHVQLLRAVIASRPSLASALPVVLVSSDVVGDQMPDTLVYAASKAAAEEAFRHATADVGPPGVALMLARLPYIGVPMRTPGSPPTPVGAQGPLPLLDAGARAVIAFLTHPQPEPGTETWHA